MNYDLVIPVGKKSGWVNYGELKYTLRSAEKFIPINKVYLVGVLPSWANNVVHIPQRDPYKNCKDANIINKVLHATFYTNTFVRMSDDQILLKKFDPTPYHLGEYTVTKTKNGWYKRLNNTCSLFKPPFYNYDAHIPVLVDGNSFRQAVLNVPYGEGRGYCVNSLYFNNYKIDRIKIPKNFVHTPKNVNLIPNETHVLNLKDRYLTPELKRYLEKKFPNPSKYEK
jgi:hypothetical protein